MKLEPRSSPLFILQAIKAGDKAGDEASFGPGYIQVCLVAIALLQPCRGIPQDILLRDPAHPDLRSQEEAGSD